MIDTITLLIPTPQFHISNPNAFTPYADLVYQNAAIKAVLNQAKQELKLGIYKPRLTLSRRMNLQGFSEIMLTIELSLPKLLFGNNVEELQQKDLAALITKLHLILNDMGVEIAQNDLKHAAVTAIHYSKNLVFKDGSSAFHFIKKIKEVSLSARLDTNQTDYRNSGQCFKWHCNGYEIVFYDKIYDLQQAKISKKRAIDPYNIFNLKILNKMRTGRKKFEILRMEIRLNTRKKIKQLFATLKIKNDVTLHQLFRPIIARKVLLHYIKFLDHKRCGLIDFKPSSDQALLITLMLYNPGLKPKKLLQFFGLKKALEIITLEELKKTVAKKHKQNWNQLLKEFENIKLPSTQKPFEIIKKQIEQYKPLKLRKSL